MHKEITKAVNDLNEDTFSRYIQLLTLNARLSSLNIAHLFNRGDITKKVMTESAIKALMRTSTGKEATIYLPILKDGLDLGKIRVFEVKTRKHDITGINCMFRFTKVIGIMPKRLSGVFPNETYGHFDPNTGDVYVLPKVYEHPGLMNRAVLETLCEIVLFNHGVEDDCYKRFFIYIVLTCFGIRREITFDKQTLLEQFTEDLFIKTSVMLHLILSIIEGVQLNDEDVMLLRMFMSQTKEESLKRLDKALELTDEFFIRKAIEDIKRKIRAMDDNCFNRIYILKKDKRLTTNLGRDCFIDEKAYISDFT